MPYQSSLFKDLKGRHLTAYTAAFTRVLETVVSRYEKRYCVRMDKIIALTGEQKKNICSRYGVHPENIAVIGGGYDGTMFRRSPKPAAGTVHILYAGKLNRNKGPECRDCLDMAEQLGSKVTNHGYASHQRLAERMQKAHVQVRPHFLKAFPLCFLRALRPDAELSLPNCQALMRYLEMSKTTPLI